MEKERGGAQEPWLQQLGGVLVAGLIAWIIKTASVESTRPVNKGNLPLSILMDLSHPLVPVYVFCWLGFVARVGLDNEGRFNPPPPTSFSCLLPPP